MTRGVLVIQPGLQHSHQLAWGLEEAGLLNTLVSGVPVRRSAAPRPWLAPERVWSKLREVELPGCKLQSHISWWAGMRVVASAGTGAQRFRNMHRWLYVVDRVSAKLPARYRPQAVVAYENAALHTFMAARRQGVQCVLDAASFHYALGNELLTSRDPVFQARIDARKQREIELADLILCCSELARESYIRAGVLPSRVHALTLGANLAEPKTLRMPSAEGPLRLAFAGAMQARKSIDLVLDCMWKLHEQMPGRVELRIYGGSDSAEWIKLARSTPNIRYVGPQPQLNLFDELASSHALLLPSRFDSFGMVVAEAMAVGTPAIVSDQTGAKCIIEQHPGAGWIVPVRAEAIEDQIKWLVNNRQAVLQARLHAVHAARDYTWSSYRQRVGQLFTCWLGQH